jgi:hypothetical protein
MNLKTFKLLLVATALWLLVGTFKPLQMTTFAAASLPLGNECFALTEAVFTSAQTRAKHLVSLGTSIRPP